MPEVNFLKNVIVPLYAPGLRSLDFNSATSTTSGKTSHGIICAIPKPIPATARHKTISTGLELFAGKDARPIVPIKNAGIPHMKITGFATFLLSIVRDTGITTAAPTSIDILATVESDMPRISTPELCVTLYTYIMIIFAMISLQTKLKTYITNSRLKHLSLNVSAKCLNENFNFSSGNGVRSLLIIAENTIGTEKNTEKTPAIIREN